MDKIKTVKDVNLAHLRVLLRVDFNVPLDAEGRITDDTRIRAVLPTIDYLIKQGAKLILMSHLGRPKGQVSPEYSLKPVAEALAKLLNQPVHFLTDCVGPDVEAVVLKMKEASLVLLENLRFHPEEEKNDQAFSKKLAALGEAYVNDAFGTAHRAHASTVGVAEFLPIRVAGFLMAKELEYLEEKTASAAQPFTVILGGAKVSDKIKVIDKLLDKADRMLIGGAMAYTFALAQGESVGDSLVEPDKIDIALDCLNKAKEKGVEFLLPVDTLITNKLDFSNLLIGESKVIEGSIPDNWQGVDIGPKTIALYEEAIRSSKTVLWNGPMGVFEVEACAKGTFAIAKVVAETECLSIIGGGDSVTALKRSGYGDKVSFISTGGGASLELLEGKELPGVSVLENFKG